MDQVICDAALGKPAHEGHRLRFGAAELQRVEHVNDAEAHRVSPARMPRYQSSKTSSDHSWAR